MQFNSYLFIFLLPLFVAAYFLLSKSGKIFGKILIIAFGIFFYIYGGIESFVILGISILINLCLSIVLTKARKGKRFISATAILIDIGLLAYYKYSGFAISAFSGLIGSETVGRDIVLPLGISFFTFQQIMYVVSVLRGEIESINLPDYLAYILYFPKLIMGPLVEPKDFIDQLNESSLKKPNWENIASGAKMFCLGLFKKMVLADTFAKGVAWGFSNISSASAGDFFLVMLFYTFEIYFDFSGYSDMAIGISRMINIELPMNFDSPYKALSMRDFWKRWHVSLTKFLTKYIYYPLGGNRKGSIRTYLNIMIVFLVSGIWHGANWTFILWGGLHGLLQIIERIFNKLKKEDNSRKDNSGARWFFTFFAVNILWLLFRSDSINQWLGLLGKMFTFQSMGISDGLLQAFVLPESTFIFEHLGLTELNRIIRGFPMLTFVIASFIICLIPENNYRNGRKLSAISMVLCAAAFVWAFLCLSSESVFVYYNF